MNPAVSILIPCYNAERWISQCIESALAQTWRNSEVIVVDDGSKDGSLEIIKGFKNRIKWENGPNRGGNVARNRLLELAKGEWIQYIDADDYLLPDKISNQMEFLRANPAADVIFGPVIMEHWSAEGARQSALAIPEPHDPWILLAAWHLPQTGAPLWRKQAIVDAGSWKENQPCCQEHELYLRLLQHGKRFAYCSNNGAVYRQWGEHTVCKRNIAETHRRRLEIEHRIERHLREHDLLTPERLTAINQARFEIARSAWQYDPDFASRLMEAVQLSQPDFIPDGEAGPLLYRWVYQFAGFRLAERVGHLKRMARGKRRGGAINAPG